MPDIAMCHGKDCPIKDKCYRHKAVPGKMQSYFMESPYKEGECKFYSEIEKGQLLRTIEK